MCAGRIEEDVPAEGDNNSSDEIERDTHRQHTNTHTHKKTGKLIERIKMFMLYIKTFAYTKL